MKKMIVSILVGLSSVSAFAFDVKIAEISQIVAPGGSPSGVGLSKVFSTIRAEVHFCKSVSSDQFTVTATQKQNYQILTLAYNGPEIDCTGPTRPQSIEIQTSMLEPYKRVLIGNAYPVNVR